MTVADKMARIRKRPGLASGRELLALLDIAEAAQRYNDAPDHLTLKALRAALAKLEEMP
jgi:hypothetical protein